MSLQRDTHYLGRWSAATNEHPMGAFKNRSSPTSTDGSYIEQDWANDLSGFLERILTAAGATPNGKIDNALSSQVYDCLMSLVLQKGNYLIEYAGNNTALNHVLTNIGFSGSLQGNGHVQIPIPYGSNGVRKLIFQWGSFTGTTSANGTDAGIYENSSINVTWPISFPNEIFGVITGGASDVWGVGFQEIAWNLSKNVNQGQFGVQCRAPNATMTGTYICLGW